MPPEARKETFFRLLLLTTPESSNGLPKVNFLLKTVVFKSQKHGYLRFRTNSPLPTLWRGDCSGSENESPHPERGTATAWGANGCTLATLGGGAFSHGRGTPVGAHAGGDGIHGPALEKICAAQICEHCGFLSQVGRCSVIKLVTSLPSEARGRQQIWLCVCNLLNSC